MALLNISATIPIFLFIYNRIDAQENETIVCPDGKEKSVGALINNPSISGFASKGRILATIGLSVRFPTIAQYIRAILIYYAFNLFKLYSKLYWSIFSLNSSIFFSI